jgi:polyhydroxybutyrate depolymerase
MNPKKDAILLVTVVVLALFAGYLVPVLLPKAAEPQLSPSVQQGIIEAGGLERTFIFHAPVGLLRHAALLIALHGSGETGEEFRRRTEYAFDRLADANGFVVAYPDGYEGHWDDCRRAASYSARSHHIDDVAFILTLIGYFQRTLDIDPGHVFAVGHSNGGQMSLRLALERPDKIRAIAAISASLPTADNLDCTPSREPVSVLVMNGTADPINPYNGGRVTIFGFGNRGTVLASDETARYFAVQDGISTAPRTERVPGGDSSRWVERLTWEDPTGLEVVLDTIHGGGHIVPQRHRIPRFLNLAAGDFDGPTEIWSFFARHFR